MILFHVSKGENANSILTEGLIPSKKRGIMHHQDKKLYFTDSLEYIRIIAEEIGHWPVYAIFQVRIDESLLELVDWEGKGHKEWSTTVSVPPKNVSLYDIMRCTNGRYCCIADSQEVAAGPEDS